MAGMAEGGIPGRDLAWLLDDLADRVRDFRRAVILSRDGLLIAASNDLTRDDADHLSAVAAAVQSLAAGTGDRFAAGGVRQTIIELEHGILFVGALPGRRRRRRRRLRDGHARQTGQAASCRAAEIPGDNHSG
jgi:predicted regulator of Ras-like GTPase activity (Roadblock/LC7/MglB family)